MNTIPGVALIAEERERQIAKEGWTTNHDATEHDKGQLVAAAIAYAASAAGIPVKTKTVSPGNCGCRSVGECTHFIIGEPRWGDPWPWELESDKRDKHNPIRKLQIAGALIAAEIDRLQQGAFMSGYRNHQVPEETFSDEIRRGKRKRCGHLADCDCQNGAFVSESQQP